MTTALEQHLIRQIRWLLNELALLRAERAAPGPLPPAAPVPAPLAPPPSAPSGPAQLAAPAEPHYMDAALGDAAFAAWLDRRNREVR